MKTSKLISIFMILLLFYLETNILAQTPYYYYYQGEKIFLQQSTNKIFMKFAQNANKEQIRSLINSNVSLQLMSNMNIEDNDLEYVILETKNGSDVSTAIIDYFKASPIIVSVTPLFLYNDVLQGLADEFAIKLKQTTTYNQLQALVEQNNCIVKEENQFITNQFMISVSKNANLNAIEMSRLFYETGFFEFSEPNFILFNIFNSNDTYFNQQWALKNTGQNGGVAGIDIKAEQAWTIALGANIKVAIVDQGVDLTHPDLQANLLQGYDPTGQNSNGAPITGAEKHGTACAGIIGAIKDNGIGISGVAPNCKIIPIHVTFGSSSTDNWLANAINLAWQNGADVISNSWGSWSPYTPMSNAINSAVTQGRGGKGCVVVFASGNNNASTVGYPASLPNVIAVGAIDKCGLRVNPNSCDPWNTWQGSDYGTALSTVAPGSNNYTTDRQGIAGYNPANGTNGDYYCCFGGTSSACPHVAGVAALVLSANPNLTGQQVRDIIESTAQKVGGYAYSVTPDHSNGTWHQEMGYGLVDAYTAVKKAVFGDGGYISGNNSVNLCQPETYTYQGEALPPTIDIVWETSPHFIIESGQGTNTVTVRLVSTSGSNPFIKVKFVANNNLLHSITKVLTLSGSLPYPSLSPTDFSISESTNWNTKSVLGVTVSVDSGAVLNITNTIYCAPNSKIIVRPGGKLILDGATITNACATQLWQGIFIEGNKYMPQTAGYQGSVEIKNGALVENARHALNTNSWWDEPYFWNSFGGIIKATNSTFKNNMNAASFEAYADYDSNGNIKDNVSYFENCNFILDNDNFFPSAGFLSHIGMWGVRGVEIKGCTFENLTNNYNGLAILTEDAGFNLDYYCDPGINNSISVLCGTCSDYKPSTFTGFDKAVQTHTTGFQYGISIDHSNFSNNNSSVEISGNNYSRIIRSNFDLSNIRNGLTLNNCTGYKVEENSFYANQLCFVYVDIAGLNLINSGTDDNLINRCQFLNLPTAIKAGGINGNTQTPYTGLEFNCNEFTNNSADIKVLSGRQIKKTQGTQLKGADNTFKSTGSSSLPCPLHQLMYCHAAYISLLAPYNPCSTSVTIYSNAASNDCKTTLCNNGAADNSIEDYNSLQEEYDSNIEEFNTLNYNQVIEDYMNGEVYSEELLQQAFDKLSKISATGNEMRDMSNYAITKILNDSILDAKLLKQWYETINTVSAKYSLSETQFQLGEYSESQSTIAQIPVKFNLNKAEIEEYNNYLRFYNLNTNVTQTNRTWYKLTEGELSELESIAGMQSGRSSVMAQGVLCFFYNNCKGLELEAVGYENSKVRSSSPYDVGTKWYYEFIDGSTTTGSFKYEYMYNEIQGDTTINGNVYQVVHKEESSKHAHGIQGALQEEFIRKETDRSTASDSQDKVYWYNRYTNEETLLYDFTAETGDEWTVKVRNCPLLIKVDSVNYTEYPDGITRKNLYVTDYFEEVNMGTLEGCFFKGKIIDKIGHEKSYFPSFIEQHCPLFPFVLNDSCVLNFIRCYKDSNTYINFKNKACDTTWLDHVGINDYANKIKIYPNPVTNILTVQTVENTTISITDLAGRKVFYKQSSAEIENINTSKWGKGIYFVSVYESNTLIKVEKVIKD